MAPRPNRDGTHPHQFGKPADLEKIAVQIGMIDRQGGSHR